MLDLRPSFHFTGAQFVHVSKRWSYSTHILTHSRHRAQCQACTSFSLMWQITAASVHSVRFIQRNLIHPLFAQMFSNIRTVMDASGTARAQYPAQGCLTWAAGDWTTDSLVSSWPPARPPSYSCPFICVCVKWSVVVLWSHISYRALTANQIPSQSQDQ